MRRGTKETERNESAIFEELTIEKVIPTTKGRPVIMHHDGSVSAIWEFDGINNTKMSEEDFVAYFRGLRSTFDDIKNHNTTVQFTMERSNRIDNIKENINKLPSFLKPRAEYLSKLADDYQLFTNKFYFSIFVAKETPNKKAFFRKKVDQFFQKDGWKIKEREKSLEDFKLRLDDLFTTGDNIAQSLRKMGAVVRPFQTKEQYYNTIQKFTRPSQHRIDFPHVNPKTNLIDKNKIDSEKALVKIDDSKNNPYESPRQALFSGVTATTTRRDFTLDGYYHAVYSLDRAPRDYISGKSIDVLESYQAEFIYTLSFKPLTMEESSSILKYKLGEKMLAAGSNEDALVRDKLKDAEVQRIDDSYATFVGGEGTGAYVSANFIIRIKEEKLLKSQRINRLSREEVLARIDQDVKKNTFQSFGYSDWVREENTQWPVFCRCIPGFANLRNGEYGVLKPIFLSTDNIPYFLALYENKKSNILHNGTNHFIDQRGNAVTFDLMDRSLPAWNYGISGQTGGGKSVLVNTILDMQFADMVITGKTPVICILDVGGERGSYSKMMRLIGGVEINLSNTVRPAIQMLEIKPERSEPTPNKLKMVLDEMMKLQPKFPLQDMENRVQSYYNEILMIGRNNLTAQKEKETFLSVFDIELNDELIELFKLRAGDCEPSQLDRTRIMGVLDVMLSDDPIAPNGLKTFGYDEIGAIILETYRQTAGRFPYLSDMLKIAADFSDPQSPEQHHKLNLFQLRLGQWTRNGTRKMFDQDTDKRINPDNPVVLVDLKGLENDPQLQLVYTLLVSQIFNDKLYFTKDVRKVMIRDEAWSVMKNAKARDYFVEDLRTARKNGFATISITQLPSDYFYPDNQAGKAIVKNMQVQFFCKFAGRKDCIEVAEEFSINSPEVIDAMMDLGLKSVTLSDGTVRTSHSRFMMVVDNSNIYVFDNKLHPFEYILYSSSAVDNSIIDYYVRKFNGAKKLEDILWIIADKKHYGDEGLAAYLDGAGYGEMAKDIREGKK